MAIVDGHIRCSRCRALKPVSAYAASTAVKGCGNRRVCQQAYSRGYEKANPEKTKASRRASYRANIEASREKLRIKQRARRAANPQAALDYQRRYYKLNSAEMLARAAEIRRQHPERAHAYMLAARYGITAAEYSRLLASQGGVCACCGAKSNRSGRRLFVDHDHHTGAVRGLICNACNAGIGHLGDTLEGVRRALNYLERAQQSPVRAMPAIRINLLQGAN